MFTSKRINPKNKNITIIGVGETGQGAAILAKKLGANVLVSCLLYTSTLPTNREV